MKGWYLCGFIAVMGFAAGASLAGDYGFVGEALDRAGGMEGGRLIYTAAESLLINAVFLLWANVVRSGAVGGLLPAAGVWLKCTLMGLCCRGLLYGGTSIRGLLLAALTAAGGALICLSMLIRKDGARAAGRLRSSLWMGGLMIEAVIIPSAAKTISLLTG